jgi:hypothetical protein
MRRLLTRALVSAIAGGLAGALVLVFAYRRAPEIGFTMDAAAPRVLWGFYNPERAGELSFAWSRAQAGITLPGLDRRVPWTCRVRLRGARPPGIPQPLVAITVDGIGTLSVDGTNEFTDVTVPVPARSDSDGVVVALASAPAFVPGGRDSRELGVQVDEIACHAASPATPPRAALRAAALAAGIFGAVFALLGAPLMGAIGSAIGVAMVQALPLVSGVALYSPLLERLVPLAAGAGAMALLVALAAFRGSGGALSPAARFAMGYSAAAFYLLAIALIHPSKTLVDALFHAHRLEWVHAGRYFFTQPMPDGVSFPYAIALYVTASAFMSLTRDHVMLLRVLVTAVHVLAGLMLYLVLARRHDDRLAGAFAVGFWPFVPHWHIVVGNANMTNAFGQSVATAAMLSAIALLPDRRAWWAVLTVFVLTLVAFLSHVSTFPLLAAGMLGVAVLFWWRGDAAVRRAGLSLAAIGAAAAVTSVLVYYGHFTEVYRSLDRVTGRAAATQPSAPAPSVALDPDMDPTLATTRGGPTPSTPVRLTTAVGVGLRAVGLPLLILAVVGGSRVVTTPRRDTLALALSGWCAAAALFVVIAILQPVEPRFYRYVVEFIGRVYYATWPALVVLAGVGAAWAWRRGPLGRGAAAALVAWVIATGGATWADWFMVSGQ